MELEMIAYIKETFHESSLPLLIRKASVMLLRKLTCVARLRNGVLSIGFALQSERVNTYTLLMIDILIFFRSWSRDHASPSHLQIVLELARLMPKFIEDYDEHFRSQAQSVISSLLDTIHYTLKAQIGRGQSFQENATTALMTALRSVNIDLVFEKSYREFCKT